MSNLVGIDVANPSHITLIEQKGLEALAAPAPHRSQFGCRDRLMQRITTETLELRHLSTPTKHHHLTKGARIDKPQL
jgi:hypothetical protein